MARAHKEYIQVTAEPLTVYVHSVEQVDMIKCVMATNETAVLFLDATGSVVRQPPRFKDDAITI